MVLITIAIILSVGMYKGRVGPCKDGALIERYGKYGKFLGCSNYGMTKCPGEGKI
jgi:ssDNA-binding Zn-finger/Zn-ribbon topoisomerase 1